MDTVLNLGAGLDTRPYRLALPPSLTWIEVDLPAMLSHKETVLSDEAPVCRLERVAADLADRAVRLALFERVNREAKRALVVTEGLIAYLTEDEVACLGADLSQHSSFSRWALDLQSPGMLKLAQAHMGSVLNGAGVPLKFGPAEGEQFFRRCGWRPFESKSLLKTAAVVGRLSPELMAHASMPEPDGPKGDMPWSGVCLFENMRTPRE